LELWQLIAIGKKNYLKAADFSILTSPNIPSENQGDIRQSIVRGLRGALMKASLTDVDIEQKTTVHNASNEMAKELARFKVAPNWSMLKLIRTFLTVDPSVVNLHPKIDLQKEWMKYYKEASWRLFKQRVTSIVELPSHIVDSISLFMKRQRKAAIEFKARVSKGILIASYFLGLLKWVFTGIIFLFAWTYLYQHHDIIDSFHKNGGNWFTRLAERIPFMPRVYWIGIIVVSLLFIRSYISFLRHVKQPVKHF
jgi:predicted unusual protein kinase regulating ubiquinone biosynthesis (AarF/ABC1/UbiB family)